MSTKKPAFMRWLAAETEDEFIEAAEQAIKVAIARLERMAPNINSTDRNERLLSQTLCEFIDAGYVNCTPETFHRGHVDVVIGHASDNGMVLLGECKIWSSTSYHRKGCVQLLARYMSGRCKRGFLVEFFFKDGMFVLLERLRAAFEKNKVLIITRPPETRGDIKGAFVTEHRHSSGALVEVLHLGCNLHHDPKAAEANLLPKKAHK